MNFATFLKIKWLYFISRVLTTVNIPIVLVCSGFIVGIIATESVIFAVFVTIFILFFIEWKFLWVFGLFLFIGFVYSSLWAHQTYGYVNQITDSYILEELGEIIEPPNEGTFNSQAIISGKNGEKFLARYSDTSERLIYGDKVLYTGLVERVQDQNYPDFYKDYLASKGVFLVLTGAEIEFYQRGTTIISSLSVFKNKLIDIIKAHTNEPQSALLSGLTLGAKEQLSQEFEDKLIQTGTTHIVSASGFNVMILFAFVMYFKRFLNRRILLITSLAAVTFYTFLIGIYILPALRAMVMIQYLIAAQLAGRKHSTFIAILLSCVVILLINPTYWRNASLILSVFASVGIFMTAPQIEKSLKGIPSVLSASISTTLAATLSTLIPVWIFFGQISVTGLLVNLIVVPLVPLATFSGAILIIFGGIFSGPVTLLVGFFANLNAKFIYNVIGIFGEIPYSVTNNVWLVGLIIIIFIFILMFFEYKRIKKLNHL